MRVKYIYTGKEFDDIQDIIQNNKLKPDYRYLFEEYLPFQVFITGRTAYQGVFVSPTVKYNPNSVSRETFCFDLYRRSYDRYLAKHSFFGCKNPMAAVSGGVDSSSVAVVTRPKVIYSGFYGEDGYDETEYSAVVAEAIGAEHSQWEMFEGDFIENLEEYSSSIGIPIAGMGGVMEYALLKKFLKNRTDLTPDGVIFGNGGDEIFCSYFFNHYVKNFVHSATNPTPYMENFLPSQRAIADQMIDLMLVASINRSGRHVLYSPFVTEHFIPRFRGLSTIQKMLSININMTLPSLLHCNQQMCTAFKLPGFNPLANEDLIGVATQINTPMSDIPKEKLRNINPDLPPQIRDNMLKRGFPMPIQKWKKARSLMQEYYLSFQKRKKFDVPEKFNGINRYTWGITQIELFLRRCGV